MRRIRFWHWAAALLAGVLGGLSARLLEDEKPARLDEVLRAAEHAEV